ncbi:MAG: S41 family peptidase [Bacteroidales bacterium]|nr:S41 family peptidase [Bacteroidales bacterium]
MKLTLAKKNLSAILLFWGIACFAQAETFLWPIKNAEIGENILFRPQEYIGNELNFERLIIHAPKGTVVLAPTDGIITSFVYTYLHSLIRLAGFRLTPTNFEIDRDFFEQKQRLCSREDQSCGTIEDVNFLSVSLGLRLQDGRTIWISGLRPTRTFRTGERIQRGDTIGTVGYFYRAIPQPAISISMSERNQTAGDPMSPFGLRTTFRRPEQRVARTVLTAEEAKNDFTILVDALREGFPGLHDFVSEQDFEAHVSQALAQMQNGIRTADFHNVVAGLIRIVRDNHLAILSRPPAPPSARRTIHFASIYIGWLNDTLIVTRAHQKYLQHLKRQVVEVDGIPADSLREVIISYINRIEGRVESHRDLELATMALILYFQNHPNTSPRENITLTFDCGETILFEGFQWDTRTPSPIEPQFRNFRDINSELSMEKLSDSVAFLGLPTFGITQVQQDQIAKFIASISETNVQNLIIDLRNNRGGPEAVMQRLFSYIAQQPFYAWQYNKVNRRGVFDFFEHTTNFAEVDLFLEYLPEKGRVGYFSRNTTAIFPNENVNFNGRVYVLINERSLSASAVFAGFVHKHRRGAIVGRETGSTYHQVKALQMAILHLPYSQIDVNVPLVKIVFDTDTSRIPFGRGVLPDFPLPLSLDEMAFVNGDAILNFAKYLIEHGYYLKEQEQPKQNRHVFLILIAIAVIVGYFVVRTVNRRRYGKVHNRK